MICPYCNIGVKIEWENTSAYVDDPKNPVTGVEIAHGQCPECDGIIVKLVFGNLGYTDFSHFVNDVQSDEIIYPKFTTRYIENEVPEIFRNEFKEAAAILSLSPKASAALSRRMLQNVLHQQYKIQRKTLAAEIDEFINMSGIPSHLAGAIDAVRNIGNFGAHPIKDTNTGEIVDVEPGEAEWLLDVLESLFDFAFVQPRRLEARKQKLNDKLKQLGKPPMKE